MQMSISGTKASGLVTEVVLKRGSTVIPMKPFPRIVETSEVAGGILIHYANLSLCAM
jgi:hypothetical protein